MLTKRFLLFFLALIVMVPATMAAVFLSWLFAASVLAGSYHDAPTGPIPQLSLALFMAGGWVGIVTLWKLYFHFRSSDHLPERWWWHVTGLLVGTTISAILVATFGTTAWPASLLFGSPLIAAIIYGGMLFRAIRQS